MGNSLSTNACLDVEDLKESTEVALAVAQSLEPAHTPPQNADASYLRQCLQCGQVSYLRQGVCLIPQCTESYLSLPADEVGRRLQSWGKPDSTTKATSHQMETSRQKRLAQSDWSGAPYKRSKGRRHREWTGSFRKGVHPRTGKGGMDKPVWWNGEYWQFQQSQSWVRAIADTVPGAEPEASGKAPEPSKEALERLGKAQELRNERPEEQRRHAAEANYGYATSARPPAIGPPAAKKTPNVPTPNLHNAANNHSKALAFDAMAKALSSPPVVKEPALPVKAMPPMHAEMSSWNTWLAKCHLC